MNEDLRKYELFRNIPKRSFHLAVLMLILGAVAVGDFKDREVKKYLNNTILSQDEKIEIQNNIIGQAENELEALKTVLLDEKSKREQFENKLDDIDDTVDDLDKLSKTDEELLMKYSKVYFLNEHYVPVELTTIDNEFIFNKTNTYKIHANVAPFLKDLLEDARDDDLSIAVVSAFRDFGTQSILKSNYKVNYGAGTANQFSADQGYSEHQLGTTLDFGTIKNGISGFDTTEEYKWLVDNAHTYGFTLSYPKNNSYYVYEPWHWRFVGKALAKKIDSADTYFYNLDQREINEYLIKIFD